eukprot:TRINITY_DN5580_c0_g1_i1.p1 TRINITY_DN5580_c0_g1~~TRINITY_DN5580_c0_g1_i1.p1  ORF type:complete len:1479 (-),score=209.56 TRINITY_DN5580_c0_g1_i1:855-5291(-)
MTVFPFILCIGFTVTHVVVATVTHDPVHLDDPSNVAEEGTSGSCLLQTSLVVDVSGEVSPQVNPVISNPVSRGSRVFAAVAADATVDVDNVGSIGHGTKPVIPKDTSVKKSSRGTSSGSFAMSGLSSTTLKRDRSHNEVDSVASLATQDSVARLVAPPETLLFMETLRVLGVLPARRGNTTIVDDAHDVPQQDITPENADQSINEWVRGIPTVFYLLAAYAAVYTFVLLSMFSVLVANPVREGVRKEGASKLLPYPEMDSWQSGFLNWLSVSWATPWVSRWGRRTHNTKINVNDLGEAGCPGDKASECYQEFNQIWSDDLRLRGSERINLYGVIFKFSGLSKVALVCFMTVCYSSLLYIGPACALNWMLSYLSYIQSERSLGVPANWDTMLLPTVKVILLFTGLPVVMAFCNSVTYLVNMRLNLRLQGALSAALYKKAQRLPAWKTTFDLQDKAMKEENDAAGATKIHKWVTEEYNFNMLVNNDIGSSLVDLQTNIAKIIALVPINIVLIVMLAQKIGWAVVSSVIIVGLCTALSYALVRQFVIRQRWAQALGSWRLNYMQEVLNGVRLVKQYAWEDAAAKVIGTRRVRELEELKKFLQWSGAVSALVVILPRIVIFGSLLTFVVIYGQVHPSEVFVMVQLLQSFRSVTTSLLITIPTVMAIGPSLKRIDVFLKLPEASIPGTKRLCDKEWLSLWPASTAPSQASAGVPSLRVKGSFSWEQNGKIALEDVDICIKQGELVAVVGEVGAGKSTLLYAMLGELLPVGDARVTMPSHIAYHAQVPYVCEGTLRDNILFWNEYDEERYEQAIWAACLRKDLEILPGGDAVPIGSRGIALSGGQRARVSLARAAYNDKTEAVIIDDPFASVDGPTGSHLMDHLLLGPLLRNRTRVVVCQPDLDRIRAFDRVIIVEGGKVKLQGSPAEIIDSPEYRVLLCSNEADLSVSMNLDNKSGSSVVPAGASTTATNVLAKAQRRDREKLAEQKQYSLRDEESQGRVDWKTVDFVFTLGGYRYYVFCIILFLLQTTCNIFGDITLSHWTNALVKLDVDTVSGSSQVQNYLGNNYHFSYLYMLYYFLFLVAGVGLFAIAWYSGMIWALNISVGLHSSILNQLLRAPLDKFFDKTPVGRIMNRLTSDLASVDFQLFAKLTSGLTQFLFVFAPICYIHVVMPKAFTVLCIPFYYVFFSLVNRYFALVVPLRYLEKTTRSTVSAHVVEAETSNITVRAYEVAEPQALRQMAVADDLLRAQTAGKTVRRWLVNRLLVLYSFFSTSVALMGVFLPSLLSFGSVSLCLTNVIVLIMAMETVLDELTNAQFVFISLDRLQEYTSVAQEKPSVCQGDRRYESFHVTVQRSNMRSLACLQQGDGRLQVSVTMANAGSVCQPCKMCVNRGVEKVDDDVSSSADAAAVDRVILQQEGEVLVAREGHTLGEFAPDVQELQGLSPWHCLVAVNGKAGSGLKMAEDLCYGRSDVVRCFCPRQESV